MESNKKSSQSKRKKNQIKVKGKNCGTITYEVENEINRQTNADFAAHQEEYWDSFQLSMIIHDSNSIV